MDNVFSQIIPLTAAMALPFPVIKATRYLLGGRPVAHSILFIVTWVITCFLVLSIAVILKSFLKGVFETITTYVPSKDFSGWIHIIIGFLFIGIGVKKVKLGLEQNNAPVPQQSIEITPSSIIRATLRTELFELKNALLLFLMIYIVLKSEMGVEQSLIASGMIAISALIWISMPLFVYFLTGRERDKVLELLKEWLMQNKDTLIIFIYLFIGISTLSSGIGALLPKLLEILFQAVA